MKFWLKYELSMHTQIALVVRCVLVIESMQGRILGNNGICHFLVH